MIDLRLPLGLLFVVLGLVMTLFGFVSGQDPMYARSLGININIVWGLVLLGFGGIVVCVAQLRREKRH